MVAPHESVLFPASTAHGPLEWLKVIDPGATPGSGRNVAQVCWLQVPLLSTHPTLLPSAVKTWRVPLSSVDVGVGAEVVEVAVGEGVGVGTPFGQ